ncbi:DUF2000 family protein [Iocasia frigidifontis]|uniref:DUF2000 family protein n=1 Tax=Iocasia fonsfrigidae TaxID=2682810 RepID=A0A8A7KDA5_9FIRM|nr:DUF2000 domain-containing protein [Iocasia fonsfrigidae]QTL98085.1 DUF2000 family protein [Iocasia fonsfrigidae]
MKCVILINEELPLGLIANTSAVLAMSIGKKYDHLIGCDVEDQDGVIHPGITQIPIPLLKGNDELLKTIRTRILNKEVNDVYMIDFCNMAQKSKNYDQYMIRMKATPTEKLSYLGIGLCGPEKAVNKLTGSLPLLR